VTEKEPQRKRIRQSEVQKLLLVAELPKQTRAEKATTTRVEKPTWAAEEAKLKGKGTKDKVQVSKGIKEKDKDVAPLKATKEKERKDEDSTKKGRKGPTKEV
jgi:hypothetical protein